RSSRRHARSDREPRWWIGLPAIGHSPEQPVAPLREIDSPPIREDSGPRLVNELELLQGTLPMPGDLVALTDRSSELSGRNFLDHERVQRPCEIGREPKALGRAPAIAVDDRCQGQQPLDRVDGGWNGIALIDGIERATDAVVELGIADRDQARQ